MTMTDIANIRLESQHIAGKTFKTAKEIVGWMGAMQAQDYAMAKWAVGVRLSDSSVGTIEAAIDKGEILRTHVLRPTWHLVLPEDIYWMLELTAPRIKASMKSRDKELELTEAIFMKTKKILEKALSRGKHLTREVIIAELGKDNIATDNNRLSHLLLHAELDGVICSGTTSGNKQTYALLNERAPQTKALTRNEALAKLAKIYFTSHGPATVPDFAWWSGLSLTDAKKALELVKEHFISEIIGNETYWFGQTFSKPHNTSSSVYLLPAFDEFIISYKNRSASLPMENHKSTISSNGIFYPVIVVGGQVRGLWKRTIKKDQVLIEINYFKPQDQTTRELVKKAAETFGDFLEKEAIVSYLAD